jgi:FixJ family two-component response regulator
MLLDGGSDAHLGITFHLHLSGFATDIFQDAHDALNWARNCPADNYLCLIVNTLGGRFAAETLVKTLALQNLSLPVFFITGEKEANRPAPAGDIPCAVRRCTPETLMQTLRDLQTEMAVKAEEYSRQEHRDA